MFKTEKFVAKARQTKVKVDFRKDTSKYDGGEMKRRSPYKPQKSNRSQERSPHHENEEQGCEEMKHWTNESGSVEIPAQIARQDISPAEQVVEVDGTTNILIDKHTTPTLGAATDGNREVTEVKTEMEEP